MLHSSSAPLLLVLDIHWLVSSPGPIYEWIRYIKPSQAGNPGRSVSSCCLLIPLPPLPQHSCDAMVPIDCSPHPADWWSQVRIYRQAGIGHAWWACMVAKKSSTWVSVTKIEDKDRRQVLNCRCDTPQKTWHLRTQGCRVTWRVKDLTVPQIGTVTQICAWRLRTIDCHLNYCHVTVCATLVCNKFCYSRVWKANLLAPIIDVACSGLTWVHGIISLS